MNYIKADNYLEECQLLKSLDKYQELYEDMAKTRSKNYTGRHCKPNTELHKQQISAKNKGAVYVRRFVDGQWEVKKTHSKDEFDAAIAEGWEKGNRPRSACNQGDGIGERISQAKKNKVNINDGQQNKFVSESELANYLNNGWVTGRLMNTPKLQNRNKDGYIVLNNGTQLLHMHKDKVEQYLLEHPDFKIGGLTREQRLKRKLM